MKRHVSVKEFIAAHDQWHEELVVLRDILRATVGHRKVGIAVRVEVADRHRNRLVAHSEVIPDLQAAVAPAEQQQHVVETITRRRDIDPSVTVEVRDRHAVRRNEARENDYE